jgi:hypothetical protein
MFDRTNLEIIKDYHKTYSIIIEALANNNIQVNNEDSFYELIKIVLKKLNVAPPTK